MKWVVCILIVIVNNLIGQNAIAFLEAPTREKIRFESNYEGFTKVPVEIVSGLILVQAEMNHSKGFFILDTGAPRMVINSGDKDGDSIAASSFSTSFEIKTKVIEQFKWADIVVRQVEALVVDLSHLEQATNHRILGMIGFNALTDRELLIDYNRAEIVIFPSKNNFAHRTAEPIASIPFSLQSHLPVIQVDICGISMVFGLDTGAGSNLLDKKYLDILPAHSYTNLRIEEIQGLDQAIKQVQTADMRLTTIGNKSVADMEYLFTDLSHLKANSAIEIDGLLGYEFFHRFRFSINYQKERIYIWEFIEL